MPEISPTETHQSIIGLGIALGYSSQIEDYAEGVCHGFSVSWIKACLINQEEVFNRRIKRIIDTPTEELIQEIKSAQEKAIKNDPSDPLSRDDIELLEILAFYDSIALHQSPRNFSEIIGKEAQDSIESITEFSQSTTLEASGGLRKCYSQTNSYSEGELANHFEEMATLINSVDPHSATPVCFMLGSHDHTISLSYNASTQEWTYMDINNWPPVSTKDPAELASLIRQSSGYQSKKDITHCDIQLFTTQADPRTAELIKKFDEFKQSKPLNLQNIDEPGGAFTLILMRDDPLRIPELLKLLESSPPTFFWARSTYSLSAGESKNPAQLAAIFGHASIIEAIATERFGKLLISAPYKDGNNVAHIATQRGHASIIEAIAKLDYGKELLNQKNNDGFTPAHLAAQNGHASIIEAIATLNDGKELLSQISNDGFTPAYLAAYYGHAAIIAAIANSPDGDKLLTQPISAGCTPIDIAIQEGKVNVINILMNQDNATELFNVPNGHGEKPIDSLISSPSTEMRKCAAQILLKTQFPVNPTTAAKNKINAIKGADTQPNADLDANDSPLKYD